jgi:hypothetical protein
MFDIPMPASEYLVDQVGKFFYFHLAPTLIFRESYPRTTRTKWNVVIMGLLELLGIVYYSYLIFREILPKFEGMHLRPIDTIEFVRLTFVCMGPAMTCMVFTHFMVLHVVQNMGAEVTR